jgi:hypothetical protein
VEWLKNRTTGHDIERKFTHAKTCRTLQILASQPILLRFKKSGGLAIFFQLLSNPDINTFFCSTGQRCHSSVQLRWKPEHESTRKAFLRLDSFFFAGFKVIINNVMKYWHYFMRIFGMKANKIIHANYKTSQNLYCDSLAFIPYSRY